MDLSKLEQRIGISFKNRSLFQQAFTHTSFTYEQVNQEVNPDNQRLEFLGDSVLGLIVSEYLYRQYPEMSEGELSQTRAQIVREPTLATFAKELNFGQYLKLGRGEDLAGGRTRPSLLADAFEAFIGALFLDQGLEAAKRFLHNEILPKVDAQWLSQMMDAKSRLQELIQREQLGTLEYRIVKVEGPPHRRHFVAEVYLNEQLLGKGSGRTKKVAEQKAAGQALSRWKKG